MTIAKLLKKAIIQFTKEYPKAEFDLVTSQGGSGMFGRWSEVSFCFNYVEESCGDYKETYIKVSIV